MLTLAVSCFGSELWLGNGTKVSASLYQQQSNRTQETPPWSWEAAFLIYWQLKWAQFIKTAAKLTANANCLLSSSRSTHAELAALSSLLNHTLLKEPCYSCKSWLQALSSENKLPNQQTCLKLWHWLRHWKHAILRVSLHLFTKHSERMIDTQTPDFRTWAMSESKQRP